MRTEWNALVKQLNRADSVAEFIVRRRVHDFPIELQDSVWQVLSGLEDFNAEVEKHRL